MTAGKGTAGRILLLRGESAHAPAAGMSSGRRSPRSRPPPGGWRAGCGHRLRGGDAFGTGREEVYPVERAVGLEWKVTGKPAGGGGKYMTLVVYPADGMSYHEKGKGWDPPYWRV